MDFSDAQGERGSNADCMLRGAAFVEDVDYFAIPFAQYV